MNLNLPIAELIAIMLGAARTGAWLMIAPPFSSRNIPGTVKALLSIGLTLPMAPYLRATVPSLQTADIIASAVLQIFVGAALGFITALLFAALQAAGDLLDLFGGFTLAMAYDPLSQNQSSVFGRFYNILATARPDLAIIDTRTGKPWIDNEKLAWVDPFREEVWAYNIAIGQEAIRRGFDEVQFDYVRFPTDGKLGAARYSKPNSKETRLPAIANEATNKHIARAQMM